MAKWNDQEDGSSGHTHLSLWDSNLERNVFWDDKAEGHMSTTMRQFLAGVLHKLPDFMVLYAPVINSYKRYVERMCVPLNTTWGIDNRTCAVRVMNNGRRAIRLENRVPGADVNFYLAFSAMLASGLYGIERQLTLPDRLAGSAYDQMTVAQAIADGQIQPLPRNLTDAIKSFESSEVAKEFLGAEFVAHFATTRRWEVKEYEKAVTNWDRRRYIELI
jgi:glutamine synthetase